MISKDEANDICDTVYCIRDSVLADNTLRALSLANDLYFKILRLTVEQLKDEDDVNEVL